MSVMRRPAATADRGLLIHEEVDRGVHGVPTPLHSSGTALTTSGRGRVPEAICRFAARQHDFQRGVVWAARLVTDRRDRGRSRLAERWNRSGGQSLGSLKAGTTRKSLADQRYAPPLDSLAIGIEAGYSRASFRRPRSVRGWLRRRSHRSVRADASTSDATAGWPPRSDCVRRSGRREYCPSQHLGPLLAFPMAGVFHCVLH